MEIWVSEDKVEMGRAAAQTAAKHLNAALAARGKASLVLATGASQFEMLAQLVDLDVDWSRVTAFHLDEYIDLPESHAASFRRYLKERFVSELPDLQQFHYVDGEAKDPERECRRLGNLIGEVTVDVACIGIGENGHLAFNDPPADFETEAPYIVVELDEACRRQQLGEGWFPTLADVPRRAISMSIRQIMKSRAIVCTVPDARKAVAVQKATEGEVTNMVPSSILQQHPMCDLFLDRNSAALLRPETLRG
jgi:glucosamine-6-phosphate deaminase